MRPTHPSWNHRSSWALAAMLGGAAAAVYLSTVSFAAPQQPTFRASVDLIAVDVQVVDSSGTPILALKPGDFEVSISGHKRRVVSADFIRSAELDVTNRPLPVMSGPMATNAWTPATPAANRGSGRVFVLAFDTDSFEIGESRDVVAAARGFVRRLRPDDRVGLYTFPVGPRMEPTLDHAQINRLVDTITGHSQSMVGEYNLSPSEIVDITAEAARDATRMTPGRAGGANPLALNNSIAFDSALQRVQQRECGGAADAACAELILTEASTKAFYLEGRATEGLNGLRSLIQLLNENPGRKIVVMFSAGIIASDRPGGRPDVGDLAKQLGRDAAATNTSIYTVHVDTRQFHLARAEHRKADRTPVAIGRDSAVSGRLLEEFSGASGGALLRVLMGGGELALDRVLRETSSHYLLGIEPADADRDGSLRELKVRVSQRGATVRSRSWVAVPKRTTT